MEWESKYFRIACDRFALNNVDFFLLATLDSTKIIETLDSDTVIFYQLHKRVWPTAQRDSCFWSHIRCMSNSEEDQPIWLVVNHTTGHPLAPV